MRAETPSAKQLAKRLIGRARGSVEASGTWASAAAQAVGDIYLSLSTWIGAEGCHALIARARADALSSHPSLEALQLRRRAEPYIEGVPESIAQNGQAATADAIQAMLVGMIELLGRLIGTDMATNLIERSLLDSAGNEAGTAKRSAGA